MVPRWRTGTICSSAAIPELTGMAKPVEHDAFVPAQDRFRHGSSRSRCVDSKSIAPVKLAVCSWRSVRAEG